jgi:hypothetical protein
MQEQARTAQQFPSPVTNDPDRMLRIARLRSLVAGGDYAVDPVLVADALLSRLSARRRVVGLDLLEGAPPAAVSRSGAPSPAAGRLGRRAG